jgi:hypothetical protein
MATVTNSRSNIFDILLCNGAAGVIVIVGVFAFAYVGERISHGSSKTNIVIEAPETTLR